MYRLRASGRVWACCCANTASSLQLPSGQFTETEEFFVKYKN